MIGSKLVNRYQILERIGGGGMAIVYKARCTLLNRIVAVKILRHQFSVDEDFVRRFRREAQAAASLSHPNIVSIYDVGQDKETYFIVMEYIEGETLKELIEREAPLEPSRAVNIGRQVANALYHAHNNKIIHRDIKPHNVLISKDGRVKVADFGIARAVTSTTQTFSPNSIMGSVHYFSPEQAKGKLATEQSDIYSLGIVFYEMLTQRLPFEGDSPVSIALKHLQQEVDPAVKYNAEVTPELQAILDKMLDKDKSQRYQNISEFLADLRNWNVAGASIGAALGSQSHEDFDTDQHTQVYSPVINKDASKPRNKKIITWAIIGSISILVLILGFFGIRALGRMLVVEEVEVPNLYNMSLEDAIEALRFVGLENYQITNEVHHDTIPENHVTNQRPQAGHVVKQNRTIELTLSKGPELVEVPLLEGTDIRQAEAQLRALGFNEIPIDYEFSETHAHGVVIRQEPKSGKIPRSQAVRLVVSEGARPISMENLVGKSYEEASTVMQELLLEERIVRWESPRGDSPGGIVTRHSPEYGASIRPGDPVDLWLRPFNRLRRDINITGLDPNSEIVIIVTDIEGETEHRVTIADEETYATEVTAWEWGRIVIYVNGVKVQETDF